MINLFLLLLLLVTALLYFTGLGWFVGVLLLGAGDRRAAVETSAIDKIPLYMLAGMITNYGLALIVQSLLASLVIGGTLAIIGLVIMVRDQFTYQRRLQSDNATTSKWIGIFVTTGVILILFLVEPISRWDARSIWFFHAKMMYYAGSTGLAAGWQNPFITFSHTDYPNLVPVIAAQLSYIVGFWNEYLPKLSLFLVLVPGIIWLFTFAHKSFSYLALYAFIPFSFTPWLWNGYMDGVLALYFSLSLLMLAAYYKTSRIHYLISALASMLLLIHVKNEGSLALLSILAALAVCFIIKKEHMQLRAFIQSRWKILVGLLVLLLPFLIWSYLKKRWGLVNDLEIGTTGSIARLVTRLTDGSFISILQAEYSEIINQVIVFCLFMFAAATWRFKLPPGLLPVFLTVAIYLAGITAIYLLTPHDLNWHLYSSVSRTMMVVNGGVIAAWYLLFEKMEHAPVADSTNKNIL